MNGWDEIDWQKQNNIIVFHVKIYITQNVVYIRLKLAAFPRIIATEKCNLFVFQVQIYNIVNVINIRLKMFLASV